MEVLIQANYSRLTIVACISLLHGCETWAVKEEDTQHIERIDRAMIRWICGASPKDGKSSDLYRL